MAGVTEYGFERKTLQEIITSLKTNLKNQQGGDLWNTETGTVVDQLFSVFGSELDQVWQGLEGVVNSYTINGAEGIYLDDLLSQQGVYRKGKTPSSGKAIIFSDFSTVTIGQVVAKGTNVSASNGLNYDVQNDVTIDNYMSCYKLSSSQLSIGQEYTFTIYNVNSPNSKIFQWTPNTESDKDTMLRNLATFVNDNITDKPSSAYFDVDTRTLYVGFSQSSNLPLPFNKGQLYVSVTPSVGIIGHTVELKSNTFGYNPLSPNSLITVSPTYVGYDSIVNWDDFNPGSEVQTDVEYRRLASTIKQTSVAGTPDSIIGNLLKIEGVVDAEIYENPTNNYVYDVSNKTVNEPYTYNVVVLGGDDNEVAQVIYDKSPANTKRYGTYTATALNSKGESVQVEFTRAGYFDVEVEVTYKTKDGTPLNDTEKNDIIKNISLAVSSLKMGDTVSTSLLEAVVFQSVSFIRLNSVSVRLKDLTLPSPSFTSSDLVADHDEKPRVLLDKVIFLRA